MAKSQKSPEGTKLSARHIRRGDVIRMPDGVEEVVRDVQIVVNLANGSNPTLSPGDFVNLLPPEELPMEER